MNIINVWLALPLQKRIFSIASVLATMAFVFLLASVTMKPKMGLLYAGLDQATAGDVIARLDGLGAKYDVRGNAIYTDIKRRDSLRLELAREGLPKQSVLGYELFDDLNSFAMSSEMFDATYWRAKEGELARTILAMPNIKAARVHLGTQKASGFSKGPEANSASVTVSTSSGMTSEQAKAIQYLTALSIVGLKPEDVAVIDTVRGLIVGPGLNMPAEMGGDGEIERTAKLKENLMSILEARVGAGNARVSVSLDVDRTRESFTERKFDPESQVVKSQTTSDVSDTSSGQNSAVTIASNLPDGGGAAGNSNSERSETSETVTYEISEMVLNREIMPGAIKRMTIAVLVDDQQIIAEDGTVTTQPRTQEEITVLRDLVASASGLDEERGDVLTVRSLAFKKPEEVDFVVKPSLMEQFTEQYLWSTIQSVILGLVALLLGLFVVRPLLSQSGAATQKNLDDLSMAPELLPMSLNETPDGGQAQMGISQASEPLKLSGPVSNDPVDLLNNKASEQVDEATELLASWLSAEPKPT
ncbi:flagellar M-ring protein FliF [Litorimonas taeanensis]|uniref:Flagellar M-ring protein n=1 Tax=Litorimonas taeanensis TaxID=568099 RepID=A0A420WMF7_9PROT|nr:flagellar basal-body MS-ring/collar protein FliF [Litorimonas taeanensis]RKQ72170.1 flagellar M-ring protein FliF [Litorimonas taeanensis]